MPMGLNVDIAGLVYTASTWVIPVLLAITLHEAAHAYAAWQLGDDTAYRKGRVTFNPLKHVDPFGTVLLPALLLIMRAPFLFGWAKPVPISFAKLRRPRRDMVIVAAAGPATNLILATVSSILFRVLHGPLDAGGRCPLDSRGERLDRTCPGVSRGAAVKRSRGLRSNVLRWSNVAGTR